MNQSLIKIRELREDISDYLFHFTKGANAFDTLQIILNEGKLRSFNEDKYICFTETPVTMLSSFFKYIEETYRIPSIIAPYGIGIRKDVLYQKGARPVIYGLKSEKKLLPETMQWRHVDMNLPNYDYSWLREWRVKCRFIRFKPQNIIVVTRYKEEQLLLHDVIIDNPDSNPQIDESMIEFKRIYRGVSIEDIEIYNSKKLLDECLTLQKEEMEE